MANNLIGNIHKIDNVVLSRIAVIVTVFCLGFAVGFVFRGAIEQDRQQAVQEARGE